MSLLVSSVSHIESPNQEQLLSSFFSIGSFNYERRRTLERVVDCRRWTEVITLWNNLNITYTQNNQNKNLSRPW